MSFSDVFRTYDSAHPLTTATMLERAAWELACADKTASRVVINTEDEPLLAAGLGLELSLMRAPVWPGNPVRDVRPRHRRISEDLRCIVWQRDAPAFGSDTPARARHSARSIRESWRFLPGECWFTGEQEIEYFQVAPACVTRGLPPAWTGRPSRPSSGARAAWKDSWPASKGSSRRKHTAQARSEGSTSKRRTAG